MPNHPTESDIEISQSSSKVVRDLMGLSTSSSFYSSWHGLHSRLLELLAM